MPLIIQSGKLLTNGGKLAMSTACCCGGGVIPCATCGVVIRGTAEVVQTNIRPVDCAGPGYNYSATFIDQFSPCDSLAASFGACSSITGIPAAYQDCDCLTLEARCNTADYNLGTDENGNCCIASRSTSKTIFYVYVFDNSQCPPDPPAGVYGQWRRIYVTAPVVVSDCIIQSLGAGCTATCPSIRDCDPIDTCQADYDGCECNEFP